MLIGNKSDLANERVVTYEKGVASAQKLKEKFYEVPLKEKYGAI